MKKFILIASIAIIAVLNFTLVKSKTGDITLKSLTELSKANAWEDPCPPVGDGTFVRDTVEIQYYQIYCENTQSYKTRKRVLIIVEQNAIIYALDWRGICVPTTDRTRLFYSYEWVYLGGCD